MNLQKNKKKKKSIKEAYKLQNIINNKQSFV